MGYLQAVWAWAGEHYTLLAAVVWVIANVAPRPAPRPDQNRWVRLFWQLVDRACVLTADRVPGRVKWLLAATPLPPSVFEAKPSSDGPDTPTNLKE
jgi:hypothetical protein